VKDHSNPLSRPYSVRLAEQGFVYRVALRHSIEPHTLDDLNNWLRERGLTPKQDYIMSNWEYYFKEEAKETATLFALKWA
jgi:hypothetical protein